jgi:hypothetical protein
MVLSGSGEVQPSNKSAFTIHSSISFDVESPPYMSLRVKGWEYQAQ